MAGMKLVGCRLVAALSRRGYGGGLGLRGRGRGRGREEVGLGDADRDPALPRAKSWPEPLGLPPEAATAALAIAPATSADSVRRGLRGRRLNASPLGRWRSSSRSRFRSPGGD